MTGERSCTAGQPTKPTDEECNRHLDHHWCGWCCGWYGVSHDFNCHTRSFMLVDGGVHSLGGCACRLCALYRVHGREAARAILAPLKRDLPMEEPSGER